jgi:hypothetical protein
MKTVKNVKNSLKFKASPKTGLLTVRVGVKKYVLPVEARMIQGGDYMFLSFSASSEIYHINGGKLVAMDANASAEAAAGSLATATKRTKRGKRGSRVAVEVPAELEAALKAIPAGHKLAIGPDGKPRIVKTRERKKKA